MKRKQRIVPTGQGGGLTRRTQVWVGSERVRPGGPARADIVFVIDTTGSMSDKIDGLLATCSRFTDEVAKKGISFRVAIVAFGDLTVEGDAIEATGFTSKVGVVKDCLRRIPRNAGGGNEGESSLEAVEKALNLEFRKGATRVVILITDEPALQGRLRPAALTAQLREAQVLAFVISPDLDYYQRMAKETGGRWWEIDAGTDFLSVLDELSAVMPQVVLEVEQLASGDVGGYPKLTNGDGTQ